VTAPHITLYDHDQRVADLLVRGYHIEIQTREVTQMVKGHRPNHVLHLLLSVVTFGLWLPVWIGVAAFGGGRREIVSRTAPTQPQMIPAQPQTIDLTKYPNRIIDWKS
jgi:hypothetical protein